MTIVNHKKIAKNTVVLYFRTFVILAISLYTSRVVLDVLGQDNYGIYNLIAGVVVLFSFITNAMTNSTQRFLNYSMGVGETKQIISVFSSARIAHLIITGVFIVATETIGLWFFTTQLNLPAGREFAAMWVYQTMVLSTIFGIIVVPYRSAIIAVERMEVFAYLSIVEVILKLAIALALPILPGDHLVVYGILYTFVSIATYGVFRLSCHRYFEHSRHRLVWDKKQFKELFTFSGWYILGGTAMVASKQGSNILINLFFNVAVNAAVGLANQVRAAVYGFITNFQTAFNPQIVKLYAAHEMPTLVSLIFKSTKFSYYLLLIMVLPIILFCNKLLEIWLTEIPPYTIIFTQLVLISSFFDTLSSPIWTAIGATGNVKVYQIVVSIILIIEVPLTYVLFKLGFNPLYAFVTNIVVAFVAYLYRLLYIRKYIYYSLRIYLKDVVWPCIRVTVISLPIPAYLAYISSETIEVILSFITSFLICCSMIWLVGLSSGERMLVTEFLKRH